MVPLSVILPGQLSHLAPGGRQTSHPWVDSSWPSACCMGGTWLSSLCLQALGFSVREAKEALVIHDGC